MIEVELPDGSIAEFPDGTSPDVIKGALRRRFAPPPKAANDPSLWAGGRVPSTNPTEGVPGMERFGAAYGGAIPSLAHGIGQRAMDLASLVTPFYASGGLDPARQQMQAQADETRALEAPLMNTGAGMAGNVAGNLVPMLAAPSVAPLSLGRLAPFVDASVQGAAYGLAQPTGADDSVAANTALGGVFGAAGQGVASGLGKLAQRAQLPALVRDSIESARRAGIPLNVSQVTSSAPIRAMQAVSKYLPFSGAARAARTQQEAFNRAVSRSFGADSSTLSDDVMRAARQKLSAEFEDIYGRNDVAVTPDLMRRLLEIERQAAADIGPDGAAVIRNQIERIVSAADEGGSMAGKLYQSVRDKIRKAEGQGGYIGSLIKSVRTELDDAAAQSVGPEDAARLARVRGGWANLRTTEDALRQVGGTTGQGSAAGNINPASLWPLIRKGSTREMRELAKIGQNVIKESIADSGTGPRTLYQNLLTAGAGMGGGAALGVSLATLGKGAALGALAGKALNSNTAATLLQQGRPMSALAKLAKPLPRVLPLAAPSAAAAFDIGTVHGMDPNDPRYRGD